MAAKQVIEGPKEGVDSQKRNIGRRGGVMLGGGGLGGTRMTAEVTLKVLQSIVSVPAR